MRKGEKRRLNKKALIAIAFIAMIIGGFVFSFASTDSEYNKSREITINLAGGSLSNSNIKWKYKYDRDIDGKKAGKVRNGVATGYVLDKHGNRHKLGLKREEVKRTGSLSTYPFPNNSSPKVGTFTQHMDFVGQTPYIWLANPTRKGYTFKGWDTNRSTESYTDDNTKGTLVHSGFFGSNYTITAKWADETKPTGEITPNSRSWASSDVSVTVTGSDAGSGVDAIRYRTQSSGGDWGAWGSWVTGSSRTIKFTGNGSRRIQVEIRDKAENVRKITSEYFQIDKTAPTLESHEVSGQRYKDGNTYWFRPNDSLSLKIAQKDPLSGNFRQYLKINTGSDIRALHNFTSSATNINYVGSYGRSNNYLSIDSAKRTGSGDEQSISWGITLKKASQTYTPEYRFTDVVGNARGYDTLGVTLKTDGVAPTHISSSITGHRYKADNGDYWFRPGDVMSVTFRQQDTESGNQRGYVRVLGSNQDVRYYHRFSQGVNDRSAVNSQYTNTSSVEVQKATRTEHNKSTGYSTSKWDVKLNTSGHSYDVQYYHRDNVGNNLDYTTAAKARVDGVAPTLSITSDGGTLTATASDSLSGVKRIKTPNGTWVNGSVATYTVTSNGTYTFTVEDNVGNQRTQSITVSNVDIIPPTIQFIPYQRDWGISNITVAPVVFDYESGIASSRYRVQTNGSWGPWTSMGSDNTVSIYISTHGESRVQVEATDKAGNTATSTSGYYRVDKNAPSISFSPNERDWENTDVRPYVEVIDTESQIKSIKYQIETNGTWGSWVDKGFSGTNIDLFSWIFTSNGTRRIRIEAEDNAGNKRTLTSGYYKVDKQSPTTTFSPNSREWSNTDATVSVKGNDSHSGVKRMRYRTERDGSWGDWREWGTGSSFPVTFSGNGSYRIEVEVEDNAGNSSKTLSGYHRVDKTNPTVSLSSTSRDWGTGNVTVTASASDSHSGVDAIRYRLETDGSWGEWTDWVSGSSRDITITDNGSSRIQVQSRDKAGNMSSIVTSSYYRIDKTNPTVSLSSTSRDWGTGNVTVTASASDSHSGVDSIRYKIETNGTWGEWTDWISGSSRDITITANDSSRIQVQSKDKAGNVSSTVTSSYYRVDKVNPSVSLSPTSRDWGTGNVTVTAAASDSHSGVDSIRYKIETNGTWGSWVDWISGSSTNITITANGSSRIQVQSKDKAGNVSSTVTSSYYRIDKTNPTISLSPTNRDWGTGNVTVTASASDSHSGINSMRYQIETNGTWGSWTDWTSSSSVSATLSAEGSSRIKVEAKDNVGNISTITSGYYKIDRTSPKVTFSPNARDWGTSNVVVSMKATDTKSGVNQMRYRIETDGSWGSWTNWSSSDTISTTLSSPGSLRLQVEAKDNVGNVSTTTSGYYRIDKAAPTVSFSPNSRPWNNTDVSVTITASDSQSGVDAIRYQIESNGSWGSWSTWTTGNTAKVSINSEGSYRIRVEAKDKVGNTSSTESGYYRVDKTAPKTTFSPNNRAWGTTNVNVSIKSTDAKSGVSQIRYRIETNGSWGSWQSWISGDSTTVTISNQGSSRVEVEAKDKVGNTSSTISSYYRVDKTAPSITLSPNSKSWGNKNVSVNISATDSKSGVDAIRYKVDTDGSSTSWSDWVTGDKVTVVIEKQGINRLEVQARDKVGNISTKVSGEYRIDKTNPTISFSPNGRDHHDEYKVRVNAADELSGVANVKYRLTESTSKPTSGWLTGSSSFDVNIYEMGTFYIHVEVTDIAGNTRYSRSNPLILHNEAPVLNKAWFTPNPAIIETDIRVNLEIQDKENNDVDVELSILHPTDSNGNRKEEYIRDYNLKYNSQSKKYQTMTYDFKPKVAGQYTMMVKLKDKYNHVLYSYSFTILDAGVVDSLVEHTDNWEKNRQRYNGLLPKEEQRDPGLFFAGEKFLLSTKTLNTTATEHLGDIGPPSNLMGILASNEHQLAQKVEVQLWEKRPNGQKAKIANMEGSDLVELELTTKTNVNGEKELIWVGEMWHESMIEWQEKDLIFEFIAYYDTHSPIPHIERKEVSKVVRSNVEYDIKMKGNDFFRLRKGK